MSIIITNGDGDVTKLSKRRVESEEILQGYIYDHPESLPLEEYKEDLQPLIVAREFPTSSGPVDALGIDRDGELYVIETKLYKNPDKRLVLAQMLDYGAALWEGYPDPAEFVGRLDESVRDHVGVSLRQKIGSFFELDDAEIGGVLDSVRDNVSDGNFRFVVLMNRLEERLKTLIRFVNENSRFDVFGVELEFYRHQDLEILLPKLYGAEVKKDLGGSSTGNRRTWSEQSFFADAEERLGPSELESVRRLFDWVDVHADQVSWGTGPARGSYNPKFDHVSQKSVFSVYSDGQLKLNFGWLTEPEAARRYAERLGSSLRERLEAFSVPGDFMGNYSKVSVEVWGSRVDEFVQVLEDVLVAPEPERGPVSEDS